MKKLFVLAMMATLLVAGSAFAGKPLARPDASFAPGLTGPFGGPGGPTTTNNDDSCDISTAPAATLLLPYFEVDFVASQATATQTIFTVTNVSAYPQIAHVTLWTDWSYPILDFNIFLTGYDVQSINLYDIIARGTIQPTTSSNPTGGPSPVGTRSFPNSGNPNISLGGCNNLATDIGPGLTADIQTALTTGSYPTFCGATRIGGTHATAIGYVTIDVASVCSFTLPSSSSYYSNEILFDNVLIGDYQQVNPNATTGNYAGGNPLVHIRAVPEGGPAGAAAIPTNFAFTFYDRYTPGATRTIDRRQPLPSQFAARYIQGGSTNFFTNYKIWREGVNNAGTACNLASSNSALAIADIVRFDEHENPTGLRTTGPIISPQTNPLLPTLPETSARATSNSIYPLISSAAGDVAGWMYLNLNNGGSVSYSSSRVFTGSPSTQGPNTNIATVNNPGGGVPTTTAVRPSQNWVIVSMFAEGRYSVDFDAAWLGNGCSLSPASNDLIGPNGGVISATNPFGNVTP